MNQAWQFQVTGLGLTSFLAVWLFREWRRLKWSVTRIYCAVAAFDLFAEGWLQPVHHCTRDNLLCTGRMYLVFFGFWLASLQVESWMRARARRAAPAALNFSQ